MAARFGPNIVSVDDYNSLRDYIRAGPLITDQYKDYRYEFGFSLKKVMFAYRYLNIHEQQHAIYVTFSRHHFNCTEPNVRARVRTSNFLKVGPIVIPEINVDSFTGQEIVDYCETYGIYGVFFYTIRRIFRGRNDNLFEGKLFVIEYTASTLPATPVGIISAVYPYYEFDYQTYRAYLEFDTRPTFHYFLSRLTVDEIVSGVHDMTHDNALDRIIRYHCRDLYHNHWYTYAGIYVSKNTTLYVIFENNTIITSIRRNNFNKPGNTCHERALIQCGGLVGLEGYELRFEFMENKNQYFGSLRDLVHTNKIKIEDRSDVSNVRSPLIVLGTPQPQDFMQKLLPHYGSYALRIENLRDRKRATLQLPTGAQFLTVREFDPNGFFHDGFPDSNGLMHLMDLWNEQPFKDSTGPYLDANPNGINGQIRSAFPNGYDP